MPSVIEKDYKDMYSSLGQFCFAVMHDRGFLPHQDIKTNRNLTIALTIFEWIASLENTETRRRYKQLIDKVCALNAFPDTANILFLHNLEGVYSAIDTSTYSAPTKMLCKTIYARFCDFVRKESLGSICPEVSPKVKKELEFAEKINKEIDWETFLPAIAEPYRLVSELLFLFGYYSLSRLRITDSSDNIFDLQWDQVNLEKEYIDFSKLQLLDEWGIRLYMEYPPFWKSLRELKSDRKPSDKDLVFLSPTNRKIYNNQLDRALIATSKKLNLKYEINAIALSWAAISKGKEILEKSKMRDLNFELSKNNELGKTLT